MVSNLEVSDVKDGETYAGEITYEKRIQKWYPGAELSTNEPDAGSEKPPGHSQNLQLIHNLLHKILQK